MGSGNSRRPSRIARAFVGFISTALVLFAFWILFLCFDGGVFWGYYFLALIPLTLAIIIWPNLHKKLPLWLTLTIHVLLVLTFTLNGIAGILAGLDDNRRATVRGVSGEWRESVALGVILLIVGILQGGAVWEARLYRKPSSRGTG
jgi:hypothetical protein